MPRRSRQPLSGLFVTGTDTGVGKTLVAAGLAAWCRMQGIDVGVMKPVATGGNTRDGRLVSDDAVTLAHAAGSTDPWPLVNPLCYRQPLAPYTAARLSRRPLRWPSLDRAVRAMAQRHRFLIIEGVGGLAVPLTRTDTVSDLIRRLGLPALIVARLGLGTLNHTLLTVQQAGRDGVKVLGVLLNESEPPSRTGGARLAQRTNPTILAERLPVPLWGVLAYRRRCAALRPAPATLARWVDAGVERRWLRWLQQAAGA